MSNSEPNFDPTQLSLHILRQLYVHRDNKDVYFDPWHGKLVPELNLPKEIIALREKWQWKVFNMLQNSGFLKKVSKHYFYRSTISDEGIKFFSQKSEGDQILEIDKIREQIDSEDKKWEMFTSDENQSRPEIVDRYKKLISKWKDSEQKLDEASRRNFHNIQRILAEYYFSQKPLSDDDLKKRIRTSKVVSTLRSFSSFLKKNFEFPEDCPKRGEFRQNNSLLSAFRSALTNVIGGGELKKWQEIPYKSKNKSGVLIQEDEEEENEEEEISDDGGTYKLDGILKDIDEILAYKKQIILHGPPGTGKTYKANEYLKAIFLVGEYESEFDLAYNDWDESYVRRCTFHPEYGYEHFIEGHRPDPEVKTELRFELRSGIFKELCSEARKIENGDKNYYLIIDEINRGDIPRIFGELITLIEADKRTRNKSTELPLSGDEFWVPPNVYIIATMNTADRSIALLDMALRRRFGFLPMKPDSSVFEKVGLWFDVKDGTPLKLWFEKLNQNLFDAISKHRHDAEDILIGHSYFLQLKGLPPEDMNDRFKKIIKYEILPLIKEYCYENKSAYETLKKFIRDTTGIVPIGEPDNAHEQSQTVQPDSSNGEGL